MSELLKEDLHFILSRTPKDIRKSIQTHGLFLGGGFIRATIAGERASDIDLFGCSKEVLRLAALELSQSRQAKLHETQNAISLFAPPRLPVQFITRWLFDNGSTLAESFDFTVAKAVVWYQQLNEKWYSFCDERFYPDLAAKRLVYTFPQRNEDAGGSMLRVRKFLQKGYNIQADSLAGVVTRMVGKIDFARCEGVAQGDERETAKMITNILREVDPLATIDGIDLVDEHEVIQ